jgi:hypothetical protein
MLIDPLLLEEILHPFKQSIRDYVINLEQEKSSSNIYQYLFYSREALINDYGLDETKKRILRFEEIRQILKQFPRPKTYDDFIELWGLKVEEASLKRFAQSTYYC